MLVIIQLEKQVGRFSTEIQTKWKSEVTILSDGEGGGLKFLKFVFSRPRVLPWPHLGSILSSNVLRSEEFSEKVRKVRKII
jgi:hypothetical protein